MYTMKEAAILVGLTYETLHKQVQKNKIQIIKIGNKKFISNEEIQNIKDNLIKLKIDKELKSKKLKKCFDCKLIQSINNFGPKSKRCRLCKSIHDKKYYNQNKAKVLETIYLYNRKNTLQIKENHKKYYQKTKHIKYGLTDLEYELLLKRSDGLCEICKYKKNLCIDHNHVTKDVRGLLCRS